MKNLKIYKDANGIVKEEEKSANMKHDWQNHKTNTDIDQEKQIYWKP